MFLDDYVTEDSELKTRKTKRQDDYSDFYYSNDYFKSNPYVYLSNPQTNKLSYFPTEAIVCFKHD